MRRAPEFFTGLAIVLIVGGGILFSVMMTLMGWDFTRLDTRKFVQESVTKEGEIKELVIKNATADIRIKKSDDDRFHFDFDVPKNSKREVTVDGGTLTLDFSDSKKWSEHIFNVKSPKITIAVPAKQYELLKINSSTGDITLESGFSFDSVDIWVSTSDVEIKSLKATDVTLRSSTGDIKIDGLEADTVELKGSTSDVKLSRLTVAKNFAVETSTGDVWCSFTHDVNVNAKTSTGRVKTDSTDTGVPCRIRTSTGDVTVKREK